MFRALAVFALAALALAGCGGRAVPAPKIALATPSLPCELPYGTEVALVLPKPGSQAANTGPIVVAASRHLAKTIALIATDRHGVVTPVATLEHLAIPPAGVHAPFPDTVYYRASGAALAAHRHYTLTLDDEAQNGCAPYAAMTGEARFST
jgi:hypothetical protein